MVKLFFAGDFCCTPSPAPIAVDERLQNRIVSCDFALCNFEVPLLPDHTEPREGLFYQHDDCPAFLEKIGFNLFSFSNNHAFDYGVDGWKKTILAFRDKPFGSGVYEEACSVKVVEKNGLKIGFLALCYAARAGVFDHFSDKNGYGCAWVNDLKINHIILESKQLVDVLIVLPHDGIEYIDAPLPETMARYRDFIDYGADIVIGSHPHCPQGWERYKGRPIFYSLGNFFFNSKQDYAYRAWNRPHWYEGLCVIISLDEQDLSHVEVELVHTRNQDNLSLLWDESPEREAHISKLNQYLVDRDLQEAYLRQALLPIMLEQELPILDGTIHRSTLKLSGKKWIKAVRNALLRKKVANDGPVSRLMRNDTRRNAFIRMMQNNTLD